MSNAPKIRVGELIGPWKLIKRLGSGGNAEVWEAKSNGDATVALKILKYVDCASESYKRFKNETAIHEKLGGRIGILPVIEYYVPENLPVGSRAWLSMPVAIPLINALGAEPKLETVVEAVAEIATTLDSISGDGISHRDIKPGNLYQYQGRWVIGDFGLVSFPDKEALTESGRKLGPQYFLAPEMLSNPRDATGFPADVYSLAKTLWVLATGQNFPPPGEHRVDVRQLSVSNYVKNNRANLLDNLIEAATRHNAEDRISMAEFAIELRAWLRHPVESTPIEDLTDLALRIRAMTEPIRRTDKLRQRRIEQGHQVLQRITNSMQSLAKAIVDITQLQNQNQNLRNDAIFLLMSRPEKHAPHEMLLRSGYCISVQSPGTCPIYLYSGVGIELLSSGRLSMVAAHIARYSDLNHRAYEPEIVWSDEHRTDLGTAQMDHTIDALIEGLNKNLRTLVERFTSMLESQSQEMRK